MILIAEIVHPGERHIKLNCALIATTQKAFPDDPITMICERGHAIAIEKALPLCGRQTQFKTFKTWNPGGVIYWPCKIIGEWINICRVIWQAKKLQPSIIFWTALFPTGLWALQFLSSIFMRSQRQAILLQGELEYLNPAANQRSDRILRFFLKSGLNDRLKSTHFVVMADYLRHRLVETLAIAPDQVKVMPHPFIYSPVSKSRNTNKLIIGTFGVLQKRKNSHYIFRLAQRFPEEISRRQIEFRAVGRHTPAFAELNTGGYVTMIGGEKFLSQQELDRNISAMDLAVFFYDNQAYQWCVSGAIHEAIQQEIPILALRNDYFEWLNRTYGNLCLLFDTLEALEDFIRKMVEGRNMHKIDQLYINMRIFKNLNTLDRQAASLRPILHW